MISDLVRLITWPMIDYLSGKTQRRRTSEIVLYILTAELAKKYSIKR